MPVTSQRRLINLFIAVSAVGLLAYALYTQYVDGLDPCPLCITQRFFFALAGLVALVAAVHHPRDMGARVYGLLIALASGAGLGVAGRQLWLQALPADQAPACGPSLEYMLEAFPLRDALTLLFAGDGNCAEVSWTFLGLSMPGWAGLWFAVFTGLGLWQLVRGARA